MTWVRANLGRNTVNRGSVRAWSEPKAAEPLEDASLGLGRKSWERVGGCAGDGRRNGADGGTSPASRRSERGKIHH